MRIAICDDDQHHINIIEDYISRLTKIYNNLDFDSFCSGDELIKHYNYEHNPFDIIFLDMEMGDTNGIETAKKLREKDQKVIIIYVTSHSEFVFDCFEVNPFRFLVKPVSFDEFSKIFNLAHLKVLKDNRPYYFTSKGTSIRLYCEDILFFESNKRQVIVHTKDADYSFYAKLDDIYKELGEFDFIIVHKSFLVNINHIIEINYSSVKLRNGIVITISESKRKSVHSEHLKFLTRSYKL